MGKKGEIEFNPFISNTTGNKVYSLRLKRRKNLMTKNKNNTVIENFFLQF